MTEEDTFVAAIRSGPADDLPRLVFADWLDERGDPRGEYLRTEVALAGSRGEPAGVDAWWDRRRKICRLAELQPLLNPAWLEAVRRGAMLPESAFPGPLPLQPHVVLDVLSRLEDFASPSGAFLSFLMVPVEPRIGEWRFAGVTTSLAEGVHQLGRFGSSLWGGDPDAAAMIRDIVGELPEDVDDLQEYEDWFADGSGFPYHMPKEVLGPHRAVVSLERGAPMDDFGVFIAEVPFPVGIPPGAAFEDAVVAGCRRPRSPGCWRQAPSRSAHRDRTCGPCWSVTRGPRTGPGGAGTGRSSRVGRTYSPADEAGRSRRWPLPCAEQRRRVGSPFGGCGTVEQRCGTNRRCSPSLHFAYGNRHSGRWERFRRAAPGGSLRPRQTGATSMNEVAPV